MRIRFVSRALAVLGFLAVAGAADAQSGTITGRVTAAEGGTPVAAAQVSVQSGGTRVAAGQSGEDGTYRIANVPAGTYTVLVTRIGFAARRTEGVQVSAGGTATVNVTLTELAAQLNQVVTTATRGAEPEKILDSPNSISVVSADRIAERSAVTVTDHIKAQPGLAISNGGLVQANIVSRGFNNAFSTSMLMLQDYRFAGVPSLRVNVPFLFTGTGEDIDRIEVLQGPASALYGPNSGAGVLHVITKSPFQSQGSSITLDGGERSLARVGLRHAGTFGNEKFGYKLSGEYFTAKDWEYLDLNETNLPTTATPLERYNYQFWGVTPTGGVDPRVPASRQGAVKTRDFDLLKYSGVARLDYRPSENTEAITTLGYSLIGSGMEITTTFGAAQVKNWSYTNLQQRFRHKKFFAQVFYNASDAGNANALDDAGTFYLRSGIPVVDQSTVLVGQLQQGFDLASARMTAGFDYIATTPKTAGTIMGRNEDDDNINEMGAYLQMTAPLSERLEFTGAVRGDQNSRIEGTQFSPRFAFVFKQTDTQNWRLTYNRAFNSPASFSFFLDQWSGTRQNLGPLANNPADGYVDAQILGNPAKEGWNYDRSCGGLCMRTGGNIIPAQANLTLNGLMNGGVAALFVNNVGNTFGLTPTQRANILAVMTALNPTATQVGTVLRDLNSRSRPAIPLSSAVDLAPLGANFSNTWELGYKGVFASKLRLAVDFWYQIRPADPTTGLIPQAVFYDPATLSTYLQGAVGPALVANGVPAAALATVFGGTNGLIPTVAGIPAGVLNMDNPLYDKSYLVFTYQNATGQVDVRGLDLALDYLFTDVFSIAATYSNLSRNVFPDAPGATPLNPLTANAAKHRATLTLRWDDQARGMATEVRGRYADAFPVNSGVLNSYNIGTAIPYEPVPVNFFTDVSFSWRLPFSQNVRWSVNAQNIFNRQVASFVGVPVVHRMMTTRLQYTF